MSFLAHSLPGKTAGIVGLGGIGRELAKRLRAFELNVVYHKRNRLGLDEESDLGVTWVSDLDEVLKSSDYVIVAASYNPSTHLMIGEPQFRMMKRSAFFINTGRGRIVDEKALLKALRRKWIAGAGLDVYWHEPPVSEPAPDPELYTFDNVILTPHIGSATYESRRLMSVRTAENIAAMARGERPQDLLNPEVFA